MRAILLKPHDCELLVATLLALPVPCAAQAIERKSDFRIASGGSAYYSLKGQLLSDGKQHLVTPQLFKAKADRTLWLQNYDYRRITPDNMATDVIAALSPVPSSDTWN